MRKRTLFASVCVGELPSAAHIKSPHPVIRTRAHVIPPDYHVLKSLSAIHTKDLHTSFP